MKPFDLEKALAGEPCITRNGQEAKIVFHDIDNKHDDQPILAIIKSPLMYVSNWYNLKGEESFYGKESENDLFMAPTTKKLWIAIDKNQLSTGKYMTSEASEFASEIAAPFAAWLVQVEVEL